MIDFQAIGIDVAERKIAQIISRLGKPRRGLEMATNKVAGVFENNYDSEGGQVGGWAQLADLTNAMREYQGYPADHPILIRYGSLRAVAVEFFKDAQAGHAISIGDDYSDNVVSGSLRIEGSVATLHMGGSYKVLNQTGHQNARTGPNPARPFWFINRATVVAGEKGIREWIESDVLR